MVITIQVSNKADAKIKEPVRLTAKIESTSGIKNIEWLCNKKVNFTVNTDQRTYNFTPSVNGEYIFTVTVWANDGTKTSATSTVDVGESQPPSQPPSPQPSPTPTGVLWTSKGIWDNGKVRTMTGHGELDPFDPLTNVRAGQNRKWHIDGKVSYLSGARARIGNAIKQSIGKKYVWEISYIHNSSLDNFSCQFFERHNEDDPEVNRYGGPTFAFHNTTIEFDEEYWHNERDGKLADKHSCSIKNGEITNLKIIGIKNKDASFNFEIFINGFKIWDKSFKSNHPEAALKEALYWRFRTNGDAPKDVKILSSSISTI